MNRATYRTVDVDGFEIFYREAGDNSKPTLLLLHGFPTSSHMFRDLIPLLADRFHLVAPDLPGFGRSALPSRQEFDYTFDNLAKVVGRFTEVIGLERFAIYIFDYGAPTGLRMALANPERITAIVSQNGNAYEEGLGDGWNPIRRYWQEPSDANREALREQLTTKLIRWQYEHGVPDITAISPDGWTLDMAYTGRPGVDEIQLDLMLDYRGNIALYPAFQAYFRAHQPRFLAIWGRNDPFFLPPGPRPTSATCRMPRCASSTPAISRWKRMSRKSPKPSWNSWGRDDGTDGRNPPVCGRRHDRLRVEDPPARKGRCGYARGETPIP